MFSKLSDAMTETATSSASRETGSGESLTLDATALGVTPCTAQDCWKGNGGTSRDKTARGKVLLLESSPWLPEAAAWALAGGGSCGAALPPLPSLDAASVALPQRRFAPEPPIENLSSPMTLRSLGPGFGVGSDASPPAGRTPLGPIGPAKQLDKPEGLGGAGASQELCDPVHPSGSPVASCSIVGFKRPDSTASSGFKGSPRRSTLETIAEEPPADLLDMAAFPSLPHSETPRSSAVVAASGGTPRSAASPAPAAGPQWTLGAAPASPAPGAAPKELPGKPAEPSWTALCGAEEQWSLVAYSKKPTTPAPPLRAEALTAARGMVAAPARAPVAKLAERAPLGNKGAAAAPAVPLPHALPPKPAGEGRRAKRAAAESAGGAGSAVSAEHLATRDLIIRSLEPSALKVLASLSCLSFGSNDSDVAGWDRLVGLMKALAAVPALRITAELQTSTSKAILSCGIVDSHTKELVMQPSARKGRELHSMGVVRGPIIAAMAVRTFLIDCAKIPLGLF